MSLLICCMCQVAIWVRSSWSGSGISDPRYWRIRTIDAKTVLQTPTAACDTWRIFVSQCLHVRRHDGVSFQEVSLFASSIHSFSLISAPHIEFSFTPEPLMLPWTKYFLEQKDWCHSCSANTMLPDYSAIVLRNGTHVPFLACCCLMSSHAFLASALSLPYVNFCLHNSSKGLINW